MTTSFDMQAMLAAAERETGLSDWGAPDFSGNMRILLESTRKPPISTISVVTPCTAGCTRHCAIG